MKMTAFLYWSGLFFGLGWYCARTDTLATIGEVCKEGYDTLIVYTAQRAEQARRNGSESPEAVAG